MHLGGQTSPTGILNRGQKTKNPEKGCFFRPFWTSLRIPWPGHTWRGCNTPPPRRRCTSSEVVTAAMAGHNPHPRACVGSVYRVLSWGVCTPGPVVHAGAGGGTGHWWWCNGPPWRPCWAPHTAAMADTRDPHGRRGSGPLHPHQCPMPPPQPLHAPQGLGCKHPRTAPCTLSPHKPWGGGCGRPWRR